MFRLPIKPFKSPRVLDFHAQLLCQLVPVQNDLLHHEAQFFKVLLVTFSLKFSIIVLKTTSLFLTILRMFRRTELLWVDVSPQLWLTFSLVTLRSSGWSNVPSILNLFCTVATLTICFCSLEISPKSKDIVVSFIYPLTATVVARCSVEYS